MNNFYTYIYYDPSRNNEPFYVGKGSGNRAWKHLKRVDIHPFVARLQLLKRNNISPIIGIYGNLDDELSFLLEEELISKLGRKDLGKGTLLNLTDGGDGAHGTSYRITPDHRKSINASLKGLKKSDEHRKNIGLSGLGRIPHNKNIPMEEDAKENLRLINTGKIRPQDTKDKISATMTGQKHSKVECKTCGKLVGVRSVNRYHNNNCKLLPI